jgi:restriction system protein
MESFIRTLTIISLLAVLGYGLYWVKEYRDKTNHLYKVIANLVDCNRDMKNTLLQGLVARFQYQGLPDNEETPLDFERFVASILRLCRGGKTSVTRAKGDYGVDIEHWRDEDVYLGQVKCCPLENKVGFEPIAIIHSQMVKQGAKGGFVVTTSDFTPMAKKYAKGLEIELISGQELVNLWTESLTAEKQRIPQVPAPKQA